MIFQFKQFDVRQDRSPMKVGTDGVLLGAWAGVRPCDRKMLDIGTGTGVIALMLAQRAPQARITGIDVEDVTEARANADASPWGCRMRFFRTPVQAFRPDERFDFVVSNPPFFVGSLTCPDAGRTAARHAVLLRQEELCDAVLRLLAPDGRFSTVLPTAEASRFLDVCGSRLRLVRRTDVRTTPRRPVKRVLMEFAAGASCGASATVAAPSSVRGSDAARSLLSPPEPEYSEIVIGTGEHECYTAEYRALTRDFYLKF